MTVAFIMDLARETFLTALAVVGPILIVGFVVGISVSFIQAVTQMQEMTISFVPKLLAILGTLIICGGWMLRQIMQYTVRILGDFHSFIHLQG